MQSRYYCS